MNLLSEELFVPSVKILLFYCLNIRTFANETNRRRNALSVRIQTEQVKKRELITPCNRPVRLIYCESGIETYSNFRYKDTQKNGSFNLLRERY